MWSSTEAIAAGDVVIAWLTREQIQPLTVTPGKEFNSKFGNYRHSDLVGLPYGSKIASRTGKGFIHVLRPTPELWTLALPHRTQILYIADIAFIISWLNIRPGSVVIEAGTGSGSFSHSVARTIGPSGKLWSYEFHEARANKAREEFTRHGMSDTVTLTHRNVCKDGFTVDEEADAVFLDLPAPWEAIEHAKKALRRDRITRVCCFSPCMEQVLRTVSALNEAKFTDITMYETLLRPHEVSQVPALQPIGAVAQKLKQSEKRREEKRIRQIASSRSRVAEKRKRPEADNGGGEEGAGDDPTVEQDTKRVKTENDAVSVDLTSSAQNFPDSLAEDPDTKMNSPTPTPTPEDPTEPSTQSLAKVMSEVRGHTSYLTFAVLLPSVVEEIQEVVDQKDGVTATSPTKSSTTPEEPLVIAAPSESTNGTEVSSLAATFPAAY